MTSPIGTSNSFSSPVRSARPAPSFKEEESAGNRVPDRFDPSETNTGSDALKVLLATVPIPPASPGGTPGGAASPRFRSVLSGGRLPVLAEPVTNSLLRQR